MRTNALKKLTDQSKPSNHFDLLTPEEESKVIETMTEGYISHMEDLSTTFIVITNPEQKQLLTKRASDASRYTDKGKAKVIKKLKEKLSAYPATFGTLLSLTVASCDANSKNYQGRSQLCSWETINKLGRSFTDELNKWRKRHHLPKVRAFIKVLENQPGRYYPHLHVYFPGLKWLAPLDVIDRLWPYGITNVKHTDSTSPAQYLAKYLSKMNGRDFMNVMLHGFHLRLYSCSRGLRYSKEAKKKQVWFFSSVGKRRIEQDTADQYIKAGYTLVGEMSIAPGGP